MNVEEIGDNPMANEMGDIECVGDNPMASFIECVGDNPMASSIEWVGDNPMASSSIEMGDINPIVSSSIEMGDINPIVSSSIEMGHVNPIVSSMKLEHDIAQSTHHELNELKKVPKPWYYALTYQSFLPGQLTVLKRKLSIRHIYMITIGSSVDTGILVASGFALGRGGPGNLLCGVITIGILIRLTLQSLAEMCVMYPNNGSFSVYFSKFIHPSWGFAMTWNYALDDWLQLPLEISSAILTVQFWFPDINCAAFVTVFLLGIALVNLFGITFYSESQVFCSTIKIIALIIFIITAIIINVGGGPNKKYYGSETWRNPGAFFNGFHGYCGVLQLVTYNFSGIEVIGQTANEAVNPRKDIPVATNNLSILVFMFHFVSLLVVSFIVPYTDSNLAFASGVNASPFVIACKLAGINGFANFMNSIIMISIFASGNNNVYGGSRTLLGLVEEKQAFQWLGYVDSFNRPLAGIAVSLAFGLFAYISTNTAKARFFFLWMVSMTGLSAIFTWGSICAAHIRFRKAWGLKGHTVEELPYIAPFGVYGSYIGLLGWLLVLIAIFYVSLFPAQYYGEVESDADVQNLTQYDFWSQFLAAPIIMIFFLIWFVFQRLKYPERGWGFISVSDIDVNSGMNPLPTLEELILERQQVKLESKAWTVIRYWFYTCYYKAMLMTSSLFVKLKTTMQ